ncbi:MAG: phospholipid carrier-dependent glycosyltransferase [Victivallales bacterium]
MNKKAFLILAGTFVLLYLGTLFFRPLYTPDEPRYAEIARELIVHNDWVVPKLDNLVYFEKPIMGHWLNAFSIMAFGENNFAARFSSAMTALLTALMLGWFVRRFTDQRLAFMTTVIYLTMGLVFGVGTYAVLDTPLNFFLTGTLAAFFCAYQCPKWNRGRIAYLAAAGVFCGGAFLTKGFLAFGIPGIVILAFLLWEKRWKCIFTLPWIPLFMVLLTVLPWALAVHHRDADFWNYFFWVEHIERFTGENSSQHPQGWWFFIPFMFVGPLPWTFLLPSVVKGYGNKYKDFFKQPLLRYAACWVIFPFLICSASSGKLVTYILPCFPGIAILLAFGLNEYFKAGKLKVFDLTLNILAIVLFAAISLLAVAQILSILGVIPRALYTPDENCKWVIAAGAVVIMGALLKKAVKQNDAYQKFGYFAFGTIIAMFAFHVIVPTIVESGKAPVGRLEKFKNKIDDKTILVSYKNLISAVCWTFKRDDVYLYHKAGELSYGLERKDSAHRLLDNENFRKMVGNPNNHVIIIMDSRKRRKELPDFEKGFWDGEIFVKEYNAK